MLRALIHHWRVHLAVLLGAAVATAVLTGALLVGDSVRGSLRDLILDRLGGIDLALVSERFFREELASDLAAEAASGVASAAPAIVVRGAAVNPEGGTRASRVAIQGVDERFVGLFEDGAGLDFERREGQVFPSVVLNAALAAELQVVVGDSLVLSFGSISDIPRETLMGDTDPGDVIASLRVSVSRILPDRGLGRFGLTPHQHQPLNAFVELSRLQRVLDQPGRVNGLFVTLDADGVGAFDANAVLTRALALEDLGLRVITAPDHFILESREFVLRPQLERELRRILDELGFPVQGVQSYLANAIDHGDRRMPYSLVVAVDEVGEATWNGLRTPAGEPVSLEGERGILLNTWAAADLSVEPGDTVEMDYYVVGPREELTTERTAFEVEGIVALEGLGADRRLTPEYPGIQDADDMLSWDPPFPVDLDEIRPKDEEYWDDYGATPKAFVSAAAGAELWSTRFGTRTSLRVGAAPGSSAEETLQRVREAVSRNMAFDRLGLELRAVKQDGLDAARGATDFAQLFLAFSMFLIVSSALLVALLFALGVEQRAGEVGLLLAVGFSLRKVRGRLLGEALVLAALGAGLGLVLGTAYAGLLMAGLRTIWLPAVGSSELFLHVVPASLAFGWLIAVLVILFSIRLTLRRLKRTPTTALLSGSFRGERKRRQGRWAPRLAISALLVAVVLIGFAAVTGQTSSPALAFGAGALLLVGGLAAFAASCRRTSRRALGLAGSAWWGMAARNSAWSPGRSILSVALVASACFVIVTVAANRQEIGAELEATDSGSGGFALVAETDVAIHQHLDTTADLFDLGFSAEDQQRLAGTQIHTLRLEPGDDASCLNLYRPDKPRILGVPHDLVARGGFAFQQSLPLPPGAESPWALLEAPLDADGGAAVIPAIADYNSAMWILKLMGLGQELVIENERGEPLRLRLVATLATSVLQSELLISEADFLEHFPSRTGYGYFLIDTPWSEAPSAAALMEERLARYGFDATSTREKLVAYKVVEHTYMSTFELLGALGLLLGTVGLGVVLVRNVIERRGELATLRAFGFRRASLVMLVLAENAYLLVLGVAIGSGAALIAVAPRLATIHVGWTSLLVTLGVVLVVGMLSSIAAVSGALRIPLLPALKAD